MSIPNAAATFRADASVIDDLPVSHSETADWVVPAIRASCCCVHLRRLRSWANWAMSGSTRVSTIDTSLVLVPKSPVELTSGVTMPAVASASDGGTAGTALRHRRSHAAT